MDSRPLVLAHRGNGFGVPENTLRAVRAALEAGMDGVEVDARLTRDGAVALLHDVTLERLAGEPCRVADLRTADLAQYRIGGEPVALLQDVLAQLGHYPGRLLNLELKGAGDDGLPDAVAAELVTRPVVPVVVSSFAPRALERFRGIAPDVPIALLVDERAMLAEAAATARSLGCAAMHLHRALLAGDATERVAWLRSLGLETRVWTVNDVAEALGLASAGVAGLISDRPRELRRALEVGCG